MQKKKIENSKTSNKDSKVVWLGTSDCILSSVYTQVTHFVTSNT
jgi:hypothetical protein